MALGSSYAISGPISRHLCLLIDYVHIRIVILWGSSGALGKAALILRAKGPSQKVS